MTENLIMYISGTFSTFLVFLCIGMVLQKRYGVWSCLLAAMFLDLILIPKFIFGFFTWQAVACSCVAFVLQIFVIPALLYRAAWWKRLLLSFYFTIGSALVEGGVFVFFGSDLDRIIDGGKLVSYIADSLILYTFFGILSVLLFRTISMRRFRVFYLLFIIFPMSWLLFIQYAFFPLPDMVFVAATALGFLGCFMLLHYTFEEEKKATLEQELRDIRHTMELEQAHYRAVEERREELARIRHDFNNQLAVIGRLVENGEKEDAEQMIRRMAEDIDHTKENPYCGIPVVNAVLQEKAEICAEKGIGLEAELEIPADLSVEPLYLCSIFANLLDNAIRASERSEASAPCIDVTAKTDGDYLFIRTVNPSKSPQPTAPGHGYGSAILDDLSRRYGGSYYTAWRDGIFTANVSLLAVE